MNAWVYVDECHAPSEAGVPKGQPFRVGALIAEAPIDRALVDGALAALAADTDPDPKGWRKKTLERGYFHASEDRSDAHSHLCAAIVSSKVQAVFRDTQWHFGTGVEEERSERELHWMMNVLSTMNVLDSDYDAVHLVIAEREHSFDREAAQTKWPSYVMESRLGSLINQPNIPMRFPRFTVEITDGKHPGVQVCDFVLWAVQRARIESLVAKGETDWLDRLGLHPWMTARTEGGPQGVGDFSLGGGKRRPFLPEMKGASPRERLEPDEFAGALLTIERAVLRCAHHADLGDKRVGHLQAELSAARSAILDPAADDAGLMSICKGFLYVCDTVPIYHPNDPSEHARVIELRRIAGELQIEANDRRREYLDFWRENRCGKEWREQIRTTRMV